MCAGSERLFSEPPAITGKQRNNSCQLVVTRAAIRKGGPFLFACHAARAPRAADIHQERRDARASAMLEAVGNTEANSWLRFAGDSLGDRLKRSEHTAGPNLFHTELFIAVLTLDVHGESSS
jgi:hypothetical protein